MDNLIAHTKKLWQSAKSSASCTNDSINDDYVDTEEAISSEPVLKDPPRVHIVPRREGGGSSNKAARTTTAVRYHMSLIEDETEFEPAKSLPDEATEARDSEDRVAGVRSGDHSATETNGACSSGEKIEGKATDETRKKMEELQRVQQEAREQELLQLDPSCWKQLAQEGYFQRAEDDLTAAARLEFERHGSTARYASLLHALAALYDKRSYEDVTGQANQLSLTSAQYAEEALNVRMTIQREGGGEGGASKEEELLLAETMVLYGQSLANYALEAQGGAKVPPSRAFADAKKYVAAGLDIRAKYGDDATLPENTFALGYVHFCQAQAVTMRPGERAVYCEREDETAAGLYGKCLDLYLQAAGLHAQRDGEEAEGSIRMVCNVALATSQLAGLEPRHYPDAEEWYTKAIAAQEAVFGPAHRRTKMLKQDLASLQKRKEEAAKGGAGGGPGAMRVAGADEEKSKEDRDELMREFLSARRKEREEEQKGRYAPP